MRKRWVKKVFLNRDKFNELAAIGYSIYISRGYTTKKARYVNGTLRITDCDRKIELDLGASTLAEYENTLDKLNRIITICEQAKKDLKKARKQMKKEESK